MSVHCVVLCLCVFSGIWWGVDSSRILVVVPTPLFSHQSVFRPFTQELAHRGHQVVVITTDPAFKTGQAPPNLTEIDLHDLSYKQWTEGFQRVITGKENDYILQIRTAFDVMIETFQKQMRSKEVREILDDETQQFDLVVTEAWVEPALALAHVYQAPAIMMNTLGIGDEIYEFMGGTMHPIIYSDIARTRRYNLTSWEQAKSVFGRIVFHRIIKSLDEKYDTVMKQLFSEDVPPIQELRKNVEMVFANTYTAWEGYRPFPLNVVHLGGMNCVPPKDLPEDFKSLIDVSERGVIYMSFGSNADPSQLPPDRLEVFSRVFATLPYDILWKWKDAPKDLPSNVHTFSWLPQADLLRHRKLLLFITQGGLQSTDEALNAGVPLLGIPLMGDQWLNVENYQRLGVGKYLDLLTLTESQLREAIEDLINAKSYREASVRVGREMQDRPQSALMRAIWGAERAIRLRGRRLPTPPPPITWDGLLHALFLTALIVPVTLIFASMLVYKMLRSLILNLIRKCRRIVKDVSVLPTHVRAAHLSLTKNN